MRPWLVVVLFVVAILFVIVVHEAGHFFSAKAFRIKVEEFFVGFGPRLWSFRRGETEYGIKALPFGGYVRIAGMNPFQEPAAEDLPRTFGAKPKWQRAVVIFSGPVTHFVIAFATLAIAFVAVGVPALRPVVAAVAPRLGGEPSPASVGGLRSGDQIVAVDGRRVSSVDEVIRYTRAHVGRPMVISVLRDHRIVTVTATPVLAADARGGRTGRIGVVLDEMPVWGPRANPLSALARAGGEVALTTKLVVTRLGSLFGPSALRRIGDLLFGTQQRRFSDPASIVGASRIAGQAAAARAWVMLLELFVALNIFVGVLNLLPLPPLDGGHLAVIGWEAVTRRKPDLRKLVPVTALVTTFLILYGVSLLYLDIVKPLPNPFR